MRCTPDRANTSEHTDDPRRGTHPRARTRRLPQVGRGPDRPLGPGADPAHPPHHRRRRTGPAAPAGGHRAGPAVPTPAAGQRAVRRASHRPQRGHGTRGSRADRDRARPAAAALQRGGRTAPRHRPGRPDEEGRPGLLTITTADGPSATTRRVVAEQAIAELRELKRAGAAVTLDAGARQLVRMVRAHPLADDPVLLGRQRELAALKVVGSGVDASRPAPARRSPRAARSRTAPPPRRASGPWSSPKADCSAQWRDELLQGAPARGLPPLAPNVDVLLLAGHGPIAGPPARLRPPARRPARRRARGQRRARPPPR